jgi:predicted AAA+ superfamily ATPase
LGFWNPPSFRRDVRGEEWSLHYLRNKAGAEVDFVLCLDGKPVTLVECKLSEDRGSPSLRSFRAALGGNARALQVVKELKRPYEDSEGIRVLRASDWLSTLVGAFSEVARSPSRA